jgi:hypothetical protein
MAFHGRIMFERRHEVDIVKLVSIVGMIGGLLLILLGIGIL